MFPKGPSKAEPVLAKGPALEPRPLGKVLVQPCLPCCAVKQGLLDVSASARQLIEEHPELVLVGSGWQRRQSEGLFDGVRSEPKPELGLFDGVRSEPKPELGLFDGVRSEPKPELGLFDVVRHRRVVAALGLRRGDLAAISRS